MYRVDQIIVGIDLPDSRPWHSANLDPPTRMAFQQAVEVAAAFEAPVHLVCVLNSISLGMLDSEEDAAQRQRDQQEAETVLAQLMEEAKDTLSASVTCRVVFGRAWLEILKAAGPSQDNLIICGTRSRGLVSRMLFGSTGLKLLRNAPCPVWLVKPHLDESTEFDVLAATDLSDVGEDVVHGAVMLAQRLPMRLSVLHVIDDSLNRQMAFAGVSAESLQQQRMTSQAAAESRLHEQLASTDFRTIETGVQVHIAEGLPDECILASIQQVKADLLILATCGRSGIPGMLIGNTVERLLPEINCSILAIKPDDFASPVPLS